MSSPDDNGEDEQKPQSVIFETTEELYGLPAKHKSPSTSGDSVVDETNASGRDAAASLPSSSRAIRHDASALAASTDPSLPKSSRAIGHEASALGAWTTGASTTGASTVAALTTGASTTGASTTGASTVAASTTGASTTGASTVAASTVAASTTGASTIGEASDEPLLPAAVNLDDAVGAPRKRSKVVDSDDPPPPGSRKAMTIAALAIVLGLVVATFIFLGRASSQRYLITCTTDQVRAERGRAFPPWGSQLLGGAQYRPIALPANAECKPLETDDARELDRQYLTILLERASGTLTAPVLDGPGKPLDVVDGQLRQALLLTRAPERRDQRKEVERLLGDVQYWRASLRLRDASAALADASKQFEAAAAQRPRHVTDAAAWATFLKRLSDDIKAGPNGSPAAGVMTAPSMTPSPVGAPAGIALPVEPTAPASGPGAPEATSGAGVPTGGVLL